MGIATDGGEPPGELAGLATARGESGQRMRLPALVALVVVLVMGTVAVAGPTTAGKGDRVIRLHNVHTKETDAILFKKDGVYVKEGLTRASWLLRDWRRDEATDMDPALIDLLWEIHTELGSQEPIHIISGYRSRSTNDMLRRTVGGQASESRGAVAEGVPQLAGEGCGGRVHSSSPALQQPLQRRHLAADAS